MFATGLAALAVAQGQVAVFGLSEDGLAAAGWITLAATLTRYADRADQIVATTIYPAIVRVRDRVDVLEELFAKSNRLTLMWAFPFGAGFVLFGADLIRFVLGDEWEPAVVLLGGLAAATALQQLGYNWFSFFRARGEPRPQAVESAVFAGSFAVLAVPGALAGGSWGFVAGRVACTGCVLAVRRAYVRRLLPGVRLGALAWRAALPVAAASAPVVAVRLALWGGERTLAQALGELALWIAGLALATRRLEAGLLRELWGYLRPGGAVDPAPTGPRPTPPSPAPPGSAVDGRRGCARPRLRPRAMRARSCGPPPRSSPASRCGATSSRSTRGCCCRWRRGCPAASGRTATSAGPTGRASRW